MISYCAKMLRSFQQIHVVSFLYPTEEYTDLTRMMNMLEEFPCYVASD